jgi:hypothetical protein
VRPVFDGSSCCSDSDAWFPIGSAGTLAKPLVVFWMVERSTTFARHQARDPEHHDFRAHSKTLIEGLIGDLDESASPYILVFRLRRLVPNRLRRNTSQALDCVLE